MAGTRKCGCLQEAVVNNNSIDVVENCVYLGSQLCNEGGSEADIMRRVALAAVTFHRLWKSFQKT